MRRLSIILLVVLAAVPAAALARGKSTGDGVFELKSAALVNKSSITGKGAIWGQLDRGTITVTDRNVNDSIWPLVSGGVASTHSTSDGGTTTYTGRDIRFRFAGGRFKIVISGLGVDLTAVGIGKATLTGNANVDDDGEWALDGGEWFPVTLSQTVVTFGGFQPAPLPVTAFP